MSGIRVKICGLVREQDVDMVNGLLPDFAGLVFAASRRKLGLDHGKELADRMVPGILKVGVFADDPQDLILTAVKDCRLDVLQLHGSETPEALARLRASLLSVGRPDVVLWKTIGVPAAGLAGDSVPDRYPATDAIANALPYASLVSAFLLDASVPIGMESIQAGGHGQKIDWLAARALALRLPLPVVLAGGLNPSNVAEAIHTAQPDVVDVSSGTETDGSKDLTKMRAFILNAKKAKAGGTICGK